MIASRARLKYKRKIERLAHFFLPEQAFHGTTLEALSQRTNFSHLDAITREQVLSFIREFCECRCQSSPLCGCPEKKFARRIVEIRECGLDHRQIADALLEEYGIEIYPADILSFLEDAVHILEALRDVADLENRPQLARSTREHIALLER